MRVITERAKYLQVLSQMAPLAQKVQGAGMSERVQALTESVRTGELLIPLIGGFSAGKSTVLNTLLGRTVLPTNVRPETALAAELRYSSEEYIEAIDEGFKVHRFALDQMDRINENAAMYSHLRVYLNCSLLKDLEPAVLVDMPGFESHFDAHNKAINAYLDKGCLYVGLISCQDGTVTATMMRQLEKIAGYGCPFHIFVSKTDLRAPDEVEKVVTEIRSQLELNFMDQEVKVGTVNNKSVEQVQALLDQLDCNALFRHKYLNSMQQLGAALSAELTLQANVLERREQEHMAQALESMKLAISKLERKQSELERNLEAQFSLIQLQDEVVARVEADLRAHEDEIINLALVGNIEKAQASFTDITHAAVVSALNGKLEEIDRKIFALCQETLGALDRELQQGCFSSVQFSSQVAQLVRTDLDLSKITASSLDSNTAAGMSSSVLTGINLLTSLALPLKGLVIGVLEVLKGILPGFFTKLFSKFNEGALRDKVREMLENAFIPQAINSLKVKLMELLAQEVRKKLTAVSQSFAKAVEEKRAALSQLTSQSQGSEQVQAQITELKQAAAQLEQLIASLA